MTSQRSIGNKDAANDLKAVAELYHAFATGLILATVVQRGRDVAADLVFRLFRRQQAAKFLSGLEKLGLTGLPHAVAAAQYHYLSNAIGGVQVEYIYERDDKAWIRYPPPRWMWAGTAICGIPSEVSAAMLRGWHANNGVMLGNLGLGFVCTKQTVDGQPGLEGYYHDYGRELAPEERLRFAPDEEGPDFDPEAAPWLASADWPEERVQKANRNYAITYVGSILPALFDLLGPKDGTALARHAAVLVGMQYHLQVLELLGIFDRSPAGFAAALTRLIAAQGDQAEWREDGPDYVVSQTDWRFLNDVADYRDPAAASLHALWQGALATHDRHCELEMGDQVGSERIWRIRRA